MVCPFPVHPLLSKNDAVGFAGGTKIVVSYRHGPSGQSGLPDLFHWCVNLLSCWITKQQGSIYYTAYLRYHFISIHLHSQLHTTCSIIFSYIWLACNPTFQLLSVLCKYNSREKQPFVPLCQEDMLNINMDTLLKTKLFSGSLLTDFRIHLFSVECSYLKQQSSLQRHCTVAAVYVDISSEAQYCLFSIISQHCL